MSVVQTHLSWVFVTPDRVYKLHKDVDLGFVSFTTQQERNLDCLRELALNRRLAPDVYLGIAPIERRGETWVVGETLSDPAGLGSGEHCLVMRRLPDGRDALHLLEAGHLSREQLERLARRLARFHGCHRFGRSSSCWARDWLDSIVRPVEANFASLLWRTPGVVPRPAVLRLRELTHEAWLKIQPAIARRHLAGRAVEGHGDLHLDHVWFESDDAEPLVIDCIAFSGELRRIDPASDIAFLAMDLSSRGRPDLAEHLLATYALASDDYGLYEVVDFFMSYRAVVRAKVAALETTDESIPALQRQEAERRARGRLDFALRAIAPRTAGTVYLVGGVIGAGKSTAARVLARATGAVVISSDIVRASAPPEDCEPVSRSWRQGRYSLRSTELVYDAMLERAASVVWSGRDVILDASWSSRARRERARDWAAACGTRALFIEIRCPRTEALVRLEARQRQGSDPSEAGPELYDDFARSFEKPDEWPSEDHIIVDTVRAGWRGRLLQEFPIRESVLASAEIDALSPTQKRP